MVEIIKGLCQHTFPRQVMAFYPEVRMNVLIRRSNLVRGTAIMSLTWFLISCSSPIPKKYIHQSEPGVTLTSLITEPYRYQGKVVILGGVIVEQKDDGNQVFLRLRNRPLDKEYVPHRPSSLDSPEAGHYWLELSKDDLPEYREWARVTVVGRVEGTRSDGEPLLNLLYLRGWGESLMNSGKYSPTVDRNYTVTVPKGARGEFGQ